MPLQLSEASDGKILLVQASGKLTKADYAPLEAAMARLVARHGRLRLLLDMSGFHGWDAGAAWADLKFGVKHHADIERIAMAGETKWQQAMANLFRPFSQAQIRYFDHTAVAAARAWLDEA